MASIGFVNWVLAVGVPVLWISSVSYFFYPMGIRYSLFINQDRPGLTRVKVEISKEELSVSLQYAELETILGDTGRSRALFELAVNQPLLDMPEVSTLDCVLIAILVRHLFRCDFIPVLCFWFPLRWGKVCLVTTTSMNIGFLWISKQRKKTVKRDIA